MSSRLTMSGSRATSTHISTHEENERQRQKISRLFWFFLFRFCRLGPVLPPGGAGGGGGVGVSCLPSTHAWNPALGPKYGGMCGFGAPCLTSGGGLLVRWLGLEG
jgi:hypothetical protein